MVVLHFPFSDVSQTKRRPALVLATLDGDDILLCQITSQASSDRHAIPLDPADFSSGGLNRPSFVRPSRLFTADSGIVLYPAGQVREHKLKEVIARIAAILEIP